jgi:glycogen debranching enzyme
MLQNRKTARDAGEEQFQISAFFSLQERRPRVLKDGNSFAVIDPNGDFLSGLGSSDGFYFHDTRYVSHYELLIEGLRPILLSSAVTDDGTMLISDLANPDLFFDQKLRLAHDSIHIRRSKFLNDGICHERIVLRSFADKQATFPLELRFQSDFADIFEVRGLERPRRGVFLDPVRAASSLALSYIGLHDERFTSTLVFDPQPEQVEADRVRFIVDLPPGGHCLIFLTMSCVEAPSQPPRENYLRSLVALRRSKRATQARPAEPARSNTIFNEAIRRAQSDIRMLTTSTAHGPYVYAGIPWFSTVFGRDALITAYLTLWCDPELARGVLGFLAANQSMTEDPLNDAEPGKILHETRDGEMAILGEVPFRHYYGSIDATLLFVMLAGAYCAQTDDLDFIRGLWPSIERALSWADLYGDLDRDGFIEYHRKTEKGLINQGWKDSHDSIFHADARIAEPPIALCEVQSYYYGARLAAALVADRLGWPETANVLRRAAEDLRRQFNKSFWCSELGTFALALDGEKRPCRVRSSNAGHALFTGIADKELAHRAARTLMDETSMSGWGIRTIATGEARYNPISYHNGSVWPHDNALIALGFARYGLRSYVLRIFEGLFSAAAYIDLRRLPELFCGFPRRPNRGPTFYPVACSPQAWAAASLLSLVQSSLGLDSDPATREVRLDHPALPRFLDEITLRSVRAGAGSLDLTVRRAAYEVAVHASHRTGGARLVLKS